MATLRQHTLDSDDNEDAESSKLKKTEDHVSDDPFDDIVPMKAMPTSPSKEKKEYLEDYE